MECVFIHFFSLKIFLYIENGNKGLLRGQKYDAGIIKLSSFNYFYKISAMLRFLKVFLPYKYHHPSRVTCAICYQFSRLHDQHRNSTRN